MRVLHFQKATGISGSERHLLALLPALAEAGVAVRMGVLASEGADRFVTALRAAGIDTVTLPAGRDANPLLLPSVWREIRRFGPDVVHTHLIHADLHVQIPARVAGVPTVSSVHSAHGFFREQPWHTLVRGAHALAARTIAISDHVAWFLSEARLCRPDAIRVVRYGIDASSWPLSDNERQRARAQLGLAPAEVAVGIASRLVPGKGHDLAIDAVMAAREREPRLRLLVAGDGPLRAALEQRVGGAGDGVRLLGFVDGIRDFMGACDAFLFPTEPWWGEGFGLAALEAMAVGLPMVATPVGAMPELILEGETGFLVHPRDPREMCEALVALASRDELRRELGRRARERVEREFSLERMCERTLAVYREVAGSDDDGPATPTKVGAGQVGRLGG